MNGAPGTIEKLDLKVGSGVHVIALTQPAGKPVSSRFTGDQLMFSLVDGRKMFVDPYVQERINAAGITPGEQFEIEKRESWQGNRRIAEVVVKRIVSRERPSALAPQGPSHGLTPPPTPAAPPLAPQPVNGAGENSAAILSRCYHQAIDIALAATAYAEMKGLRITPAFEDIRAMAATICINESGRR
jgi:hypothetical protein